MDASLHLHPPAPTVRGPGWRRALAWATVALAFTLAALALTGLLPAPPWLRREPVLWRQLTGYAMLALLVLGLSFGLLRRNPRTRLGHTSWLLLHQGLGLALLMLLALHAGGRPAGFLLVLLLLMAASALAGAARVLVQPGGRPATGRVLLAAHIVLACAAAALVIGHLLFVYAYTR